MSAQENMVEKIKLSTGRSYALMDQESVSSAKTYAPAIEQAETTPNNGSHEISEDELLQRVNQVNTEINNANVTLKIQVDQETGKNMVQVVNRETGEVLRQIPPEETVKLEARIEKMIGMFVDSTL